MDFFPWGRKHRPCSKKKAHTGSSGQPSGPSRDGAVTSPCPQAGTLNTLDKAACSSPAAGSQVASAFKTLGLVPTGPASTLAIQQTGPQTVNTQKARLGFLPDTRKQRVPSAGAGGQSRTATSEHSLLSHSFSKNQNKRSLLCIEGI